MLNYLHSGAFSGSAISLRAALEKKATLRSLDLMPLSRRPELALSRARAVLEAHRTEGGAPWVKTAAWSAGVQRRLRRLGALDPAVPLLVVQSLPAFVEPGPRYAVYTDRVGREGAAVGGRYSSRFSAAWLDRETRFMRGAEKVFVMGPSTVKVLVDEYGCDPGRISVIGAGPNMALRGPRYRTECRRLLFVGTQWQLKGGPELLEAFAQVRKTYPELELLLAGSAPGGTLPDGVRALGRGAHAEMDSVYEQADLLVIPTHMEAFGIALVEGMMKGLPAVCSSVGNQPTIVQNAGLAVIPGDAGVLARALRTVIADYARYHANALRRGAQLRATMQWDQVAERILEEFVTTSNRQESSNREVADHFDRSYSWPASRTHEK